MTHFLILYFGFCVGFSLSSNMSVNEEIVQGNILGDPIKWYEILFGMLMSPLTVPIVFFILLRNKIDE